MFLFDGCSIRVFQNIGLRPQPTRGNDSGGSIRDLKPTAAVSTREDNAERRPCKLCPHYVCCRAFYLDFNSAMNGSPLDQFCGMDQLL